MTTFAKYRWFFAATALASLMVLASCQDNGSSAPAKSNKSSDQKGLINPSPPAGPPSSPPITPVATATCVDTGANTGGSVTGSGVAPATGSLPLPNAPTTTTFPSNPSNPGSTLGVGTPTSTDTSVLGGTIFGSPLDLTATQPNYNDDIQAYLSSNCTSCHSPTGSHPNPDLTTYAGAQAQAQASLNDLQNGSMPPKPATAQPADIQMFQAWVTANTPQSGATASGGGSPVGATPAGASPPVASTLPPCQNTGGIGGASTGLGGSGTSTDTLGAGGSGDPFSELLNPPAMQQCQAQGVIFDRGAGTCRTAKVATSYQCNDQGIIQAFQKVGIGVQPQLTQFESAGYQIDQCGELNGEPVVFFYFKDVSDPTTAKVQIKKLCKQNSPACTQ